MLLLYFFLLVCVIIGIQLFRFLQVPKQLKELPSAPLSSFFQLSFSKKSFSETIQQYIQPDLLKNGGIIRVLTIQGWAIYVSNPKLLKEIFHRHEEFGKMDYVNLVGNQNFTEFFGEHSILMVNNPVWRRLRNFVNPTFRKSWQPELFADSCRELINVWMNYADLSSVDVRDTFEKLTLDVLGRMIFDVNFESITNPNCEFYQTYTQIMDSLFSSFIYFVFPKLENLPIVGRPEFVKLIHRYNGLIDNIIQERKLSIEQNTNLKENQNLLTDLICANEKTDDKLTHKEIRDNLKIMILAGHDTTSNTLSNTFYYLAKYPEIQKKLRDEIMTALDYPTTLTTPTVDQLKQMPYIDLVIKESMRIMTTVNNVQRVPRETVTLSNGVTIPAGTSMSLHMWVNHHDPVLYPNPDEFIPERFDSANVEASQSWMPFISGARTCIGTTFSLMEQRVVLCLLLQKFKFEIHPDNPDFERLRLNSIAILKPIDLRLSLKVLM